MQFSRALIAIIVGSFLTIIFGLGGCFVLFWFKAISFRWSSKGVGLAPLIIGLWAYLIDEICIKCLLGMKVKIEVIGDVRPIKDNEITICFGNHPSTILIPTFTRFVTYHISRNIFAIAKREHLFNPFIGWFMWLANISIFVDRSRSEASNIAVREGADNLHAPSVVVIFPDMRRPSRKRIISDHEKFVSKIPDIKNWLCHTLVPRGGALFTLSNSLSEKDTRFINMTVACSEDDTSIWNTCRLVGAVVLIRIKEVRPPYESREDLNNWLNSEWRRKNYLITRWKRKRPNREESR